MPTLNFDDPCATARDEAAPRLARGHDLRPTLLGFEGDEPTLYVRSAPAWVGVTRDSVAAGLVMLPCLLGIRRLLVVCESRVTDHSIDDPVARDAHAERGVLVTRAEQHGDDRPVTSGHLLTWQRSGPQQVAWDAPIGFDDDGPWGGILVHALGQAGGEGPGDGRPNSVVYGLSRCGVVVAVAPRWRERYGLDQPVDPRGVRREDRRRAHAHRSAGRPSTVEAAS